MAVINSFLLVFSLILRPEVHPLKMTTSKVVLNSENHRLETTCNFFFDDFSAHMNTLYHVDISNLDSLELSAIEDYINQNFRIKTDDENITFNLVSSELIDENVLQIKMASPIGSIDKLKTIEITNTLLFDAFPKEQANIVHLTIGEFYKILRFSIQEGRQQVNLENQ